jgi:hypothetical protein
MISGTASPSFSKPAQGGHLPVQHGRDPGRGLPPPSSATKHVVQPVVAVHESPVRGRTYRPARQAGREPLGEFGVPGHLPADGQLPLPLPAG